MRNSKLITSALVAVLLVLSACSEFEGGSGEPTTTATTTTTTVAGAPAPGPTITGDPTAIWPLIDGQPLPTGATEGGDLVGQLRNLGADEVPWGENPLQVVVDRAHQEPLFASELAQAFGGEAAGQVAFWGLDGLWKDGKWTDAGNGFLKLLDAELLVRYQGLGDLPESNDYQVVFANAEKDAVRLTLNGSDLVAVGEVLVLETECGVVAVDVKGNLYVPCDCARIPIKRVPPPPPPPCEGDECGGGGKDARKRPPQDPVVKCPEGQIADRVTGDCKPAPGPGDSLPDQGDPGNGDSGPGAPGTGVSTPTTDPAPDPTVPTDTGNGDGSIPDPGV